MPEAGAADSPQQDFAAIPQILRHLKMFPRAAHATPLSPRVGGSWSRLCFDAGERSRGSPVD